MEFIALAPPARMKKLTTFQIESWARTVIERLVSGGHVEDARVELKANWPVEARDAARRIAGQANAARGEPILYLVGISEGEKKVVGALQGNLANWWPQVCKYFDSFAPRMHDHAFAYEPGKTVVALYFETDGAPFVVTTGIGGAVTHEVPWRHATGIRSATRADLFSLLTPVARLPDVEFLSADIRLRPEAIGTGVRGWEARVRLYVAPRTPEQVTIPYHRCKLLVRFSESSPCVEANQLFRIVGSPQGGNQTVVYEPRQIEVQATGQIDASYPLSMAPICRVSVRLGVVGAANAIIMDYTVPPIENTNSQERQWILEGTGGE